MPAQSSPEQPRTVRPEQPIAVASLDFDPENPRFLDTAGNTAPGAGEDGQALPVPPIKRMFEQENVEELVASIGQQDYFPGEPLLVTPNPHAPGRFLVIEGNRRLAALRALGDLVPPDQMLPSISDAVAQARFRPTEVACYVFPERRDILKYLGFRHISGPRRWEPLSKARYLADLVRNFYSELSLDEQLKSLARDIGSRRDYVAQLLTTLNLYDRARAADFYGLQRVRDKDISFSLLSTALSYRSIIEFINLPSRDSVNVDAVRDDHAKELLAWMFAQDQSGETVLGESRRLGKLAAVVSSEAAVAELRKSSDLDQAYLYTSGPTEAFSKLLVTADEALSECLLLLGGDLSPDTGHEALIERIVSRADSLEILVQKAKRQKEKRERHGEGQSNA